MSQNDDYGKRGDEDSSRTLDAGKPLHEIGSRIGNYRLLSILGEGGFGIVYLAQQQQPIKRLVALKVIKPGMDTKQVIARFETERQALALLDHPNIAQVLEAGTTEAGRPYFAMEYVKGIPITQYCDKYKLGTAERLRLFIPLCQAIQHAHLKGIIHRDIKPSNALVMVQEDKPIPKVIDFGVAKALHQRLTEKTLATERGEFIGTPEYMSPEQAELTGLDVDTRTDIYSLGVLLYELLTGSTPFDPADLRSKGYAQMQRIICEQEPVKPSTKLTTLGGKAEDIAKHHSATAEQLRKSVQGDLDWIVMKALEKDRARRYGTAQALVEDIERHLNHQPVSARSPTVRYRTGKYVRRHRRVLAAAMVFAVLLILGTTLSVWEAHRAGQAENERASLRKVQWALGTAMPQIERLLEKDDYTAAFKLVEQARPFIEEDPRFQALSARVVSVISIESTPPGAEVFLRDYRDVNAPWDLMGHTPLEKVRVPRMFHRWKMTLDGYEAVEGACMIYAEKSAAHEDIQVTLDKKGALAPGMVRIQGGKFRPRLGGLATSKLDEIALSDYLLDRYEVSNRQFKEFVDAGGYQQPQFWKHKFVKEDREWTWAEAMTWFVDQTGQPGPRTWKNGDFPKGQEGYPVGGVSWYEAAAYAEWAGKRLPTLYHWNFAAVTRYDYELRIADFLGDVILQSNFGGQGPAPAGQYQGMTPRGVYDLAGNAKEWCLNETTDGLRLILGGGWNEPEYMFNNADKYPPFFREASFGFRCMKLLSNDSVWKQAGCSVQWRPPPTLGDQKPCSDELFQAFRRQYDYNKLELRPAVEANEVLSIYTRREKVSFNAAYGDERMIAYLYLPRTGKPPFQTVIYWPGGGRLGDPFHIRIRIYRPLRLSHEDRPRFRVPGSAGNLREDEAPRKTRQDDPARRQFHVD